MQHDGMPQLEAAPPLSPFEFWPPQLFYLPVWTVALALAVRYRGLRLPLLANPRFPAGGLVGEEKSAILDMVEPAARRWFAPHTHMDVRGDGSDIDRALAAVAKAGLDFPLVAKPDLGCRGAGVRPVRDAAELRDYILAFPANARIVLQTLIDWPGEAGVFWVKEPGQPRGRILSLTLKYFPKVIGDGERTLEALIRADSRAGQVAHLYLGRNAERLAEIVPEGEHVRLAFAGSHSRGAIFRDGTHLVTPAMEARFEAIAGAIPEFWFGRFDVRFRDFADLAGGGDFRILEVNGAGAEATHIWDSRMPLGQAYRSLFRQWRILFAIGAANRARGFRAEPAAAFVRRWRTEKRLTPLYPETA